MIEQCCRNLTDDDGNNLWPEFLTFLFTMASSQSPDAKEIALHMFASVPGVFGSQEKQYIEVIESSLDVTTDNLIYAAGHQEHVVKFTGGPHPRC